MRQHERVAQDVQRSEFAAELSGRVAESHFARVYEGRPPSREVVRTEHFIALVDLAPLTLGHMLVVPRREVPSFAVLPEEAWREWKHLRARLVETLSERWTHPIQFEHGSTHAMRGSACVTHAHLQFLPAELDLAEEMRRDGLVVFDVSDQRDLVPLARGQERPYFFVETSDGRAHSAWADEPIMRSQYLRRTAARALGLPDPDWDWEAVVRRDLLRATVAELSARSLHV